VDVGAAVVEEEAWSSKQLEEEVDIVLEGVVTLVVCFCWGWYWYWCDMMTDGLTDL